VHVIGADVEGVERPSSVRADLANRPIDDRALINVEKNRTL